MRCYFGFCVLRDYSLLFSYVLIITLIIIRLVSGWMFLVGYRGLGLWEFGVFGFVDFGVFLEHVILGCFWSM